ncbi:MAG: FAD synthase [bacterium]|nr:FAD synthase [bacterium]
MAQEGQIIGYTTGVYDMFHVGHLNILKRAKEHCDYLIVGVSTDETVMSYKHKSPIIPYKERAEIVKAIRYVDEVVPQVSMDKYEAWKKLKFDILFHGDDWKGTDLYNKYEKQFSEVGVKIIYLPHTDGISSTKLTKVLKSLTF